LRVTPFALFGFVLIVGSVASYLLGVFIAVPRRLLFTDPIFLEINEAIVWYSGAPLMLGMGLVAADLLRKVRVLRSRRVLRDDDVSPVAVTVALTAYNDECSIADSVQDFIEHPMVRRVIVISNKSSDRTMKRALEAGAEVYNEPTQGYGPC
jgi:hypothetical protein